VQGRDTVDWEIQIKMATASAAVAYKKQDGQILLKEHHVEWAPKGAMQALLNIALISITSECYLIMCKANLRPTSESSH
jgi:hypothetical protein